jgi:hypothetical protein
MCFRCHSCHNLFWPEYLMKIGNPKVACREMWRAGAPPSRSGYGSSAERAGWLLDGPCNHHGRGPRSPRSQSGQAAFHVGVVYDQRRAQPCPAHQRRAFKQTARHFLSGSDCQRAHRRKSALCGHARDRRRASRQHVVINLERRSKCARRRRRACAFRPAPVERNRRRFPQLDAMAGRVIPVNGA